MSPKTPEPNPIAIVLAPEILAKSFHNSQCKKVLELWRDGSLRPIITRDLLIAYLRLLKALRIPDEILRRWTQWFTATSKSTVLRDANPDQQQPANLLADAAQRGNAETILYVDIPPAASATDPPRQTVTKFLENLRANESP